MFDQDFCAHPDQDETSGESDLILKKMTSPISEKNADKREKEGDRSNYYY
jgi:hypothetical protein